jgi:hypothetical protein
VQVVILGIINAGFMLTPTAVVSDRDIIDGQGNTLSVLAEALTKTASGNPVVINDCAGGKARSLITEINAIQDLHGQSAPYVGGAYKNKLPMILSDIKAANTDGTWSDNVYTINGGTITILTDSDGNVTGIKANGTFNASVTFVIAYYNCFLAANTYIFGAAQHSNDSYGGANNHYYFLSNVNGTSSWVAASHLGLSTRTFTVTDPTKGIRCGFYIESGASLSNELSYPMIRLSSVTDDLFAPYSNICPISGRSSVVLTRSDGDEISEDFTIQLGQTVYGADINWDTGVMTVRTAAETFDGSNDENWELSGSGKRVYTNNLASVIKAPASGEIVANIISNEFKATSGNNTYAGNIGVSVDTTGLLGVSDGTGSMSPSAFKTWLTSNPLQVCYELATPTTIQLTPEQLELLKGYNRVTIESGSIELGYIAKLT